MPFMLDFLGNELQVGDRVIYIEKDYREFNFGIVTKINNKKIQIDHCCPRYGSDVIKLPVENKSESMTSQ